MPVIYSTTHSTQISTIIHPHPLRYSYEVLLFGWTVIEASMDRLRSNDQHGPSRRLITSVIDQIAEEEPKATWIVAPTNDGYCNLSYRQFATAINGVSWWLERQIGRGDGSTSLVFFGTGGGDIRYPILLLGAVKAGYYVSSLTLLLSSEGDNSDARHFSTLHVTASTPTSTSSAYKIAKSWSFLTLTLHTLLPCWKLIRCKYFNSLI